MTRSFRAFSVAGAFAVAALLLAQPASAANIVLNGGFETGDFTSWTLSGNTGFTGVDGNQHSGASAAFLGPVGSVGDLTQALATTAGTTYDLEFWLSNSGGTPNSFSAFWNGNLLVALTNTGASGYAAFNYQVLGTGSDTLKFEYRQDPGFWYLDDVSVQAAVPEPASLLLLGTGLIGAGLRRRNRRKLSQ